MNARWRPRLLWVLLGSMLPLLFLLDWLVDRTGRRQVHIDTELLVQLEGEEPLLLAMPMNGAATERGLEVEGFAVLKEARYPWRPTHYEGRLVLRLTPEFLGEAGLGPRTGGFSASYRVRELGRADGYGTPPVPCRGTIQVQALDWEVGRPGLKGLEQAELRLDLTCVSAGPDLRFGTGDETSWSITGPMRVDSGQVGS